MSMLVRVRCVDDGRELLVEGRRLEWRVQVATIKRLVLQQRRRQSGGRPTSTHDQEDDHEETLGGSFLLFQGRILADSDMVNLFSLTPTDFFVFVQEHEPSGEPSGGLTEDQVPGTGRKRTVDPQVRQQLLEMGFTRAQVDGALLCGETELDQLVERIMNGRSEEAPAMQPSQRQRGGPQVHATVDPEVQELQQKALADPFDAIMMLKEHFSSDALASLTENPVSTIQTLRQATARPVTQPSAVVQDAPRYSALEDAATDDQESKDNGNADDDASDPIERVRCCC